MHRTVLNEEFEIIKVCRSVRSWILASTGCGTMGCCYDASRAIQRRLAKRYIFVKLVGGVFRVDFDCCGKPTTRPSHEECHYWCEWKRIPIDVTADQFNPKLLPINKVKPIIFGTDFEKYLAWNFQPIYV